jgi:hypothetical protein
VKYFYLTLLIIVSSASATEKSEQSWICATETKSGTEPSVRIEQFLVLESTIQEAFVKKAMQTPRGPAIVELRVEKTDQGGVEAYPKIKFGMDRMPSASMPAEILRNKNGQMQAEASLQLPSDLRKPSLEIKLICVSIPRS